MTNFDALIAHRVSDVDPQAWPVEGADGPFSSYSWYQFCENIMPDCTPVHILLFRDGKTTARGSFWIMRSDALPVNSAVGRKAARWVMQRRPLLVCRSPVANVSGLALPARMRREALAALMTTAEKFARENKVSFLLYDYLTAKEVEQAQVLDGYAGMQVSEPGTALKIQWNTFESYLASLSRQAWKDYRRHSNQAARLGIRIRALSAVTDLQEAVGLIRRVEQHHGSMPNPWVENILTHMETAGGTWLEARQNERLVGCGLLLRDGDHQVATLLGLDYGTRYAYFPFVYCAIQSAIEHGVKVFHAGSGAYELKQRLGFTLEDNHNLAFTGIGPLFSSVVRLVTPGRRDHGRAPVEEGFECS